MSIDLTKRQDKGSKLTIAEMDSNFNAIEQGVNDNESNLSSKVDKVAGKQLSTEDFTTSYKEKLDQTTGTFTLTRENKLDNLEPNWRGSFLLSSELLAAYPTPQAGWGAWVYETNTLWAVKGGAWDNTGGSSFGNMNTELYDPQGIAADAFDRTKHTGNQPTSSVSGLDASLQTLNQLNTLVRNPSGGLEFRIMRNEINIGDLNSGLTKQVYANQAIIGSDENSGLRGQVKRLVQGTIFEHDVSAKYVHGQLVYYTNVNGDKFIARANSDIDGTMADVDFAEGNDGQLNTWTTIASLGNVLDSGAKTVMGTAVYTEESLDWTKLIELGSLSISVRNDNSISSQVVLRSSETLTVMWTDNQSGGNISTINASGIIWSRHATAGVPRNIDIVGSVSGKEYKIKIMVRLLNQGTSSQTVRCSASITMI